MLAGVSPDLHDTLSMHLATRLRRPLAFVFAVLLLAVGSASPVQAASKKERYYEYTSTVMRLVAEGVAAESGFDLTAEHIEAVEDGSQVSWMFPASNKLCKMMIAAKTTAQRKRVAREVVNVLSDEAVEVLQRIVADRLPGDETRFWSAMVGAQYVTVIVSSQNVLCKGQSKHIEPMVAAYLSAVEKKASARLGA